MFTWQFEAIGTNWHIDVPQLDESNTQEIERVRNQITNLIESYDKIWSRFRDDSLVQKIAQKAGTYPIPSRDHALIKLYFKLHEATGGAITPLIGQTLVDLGYDASYTLQKKIDQLYTPPPLSEVLSFEAPNLYVTQPALLDVGCAGKGYLIELMSDLLTTLGYSKHTIDGSGDIKQASSEKITIGLEHPLTTEQVVGTVTLANTSLAGSAGNRRKWQGLHHIIDPRTRNSPTQTLATWVISENAAEADGLATALFLVEPTELQQAFSFEFARLTTTMHLEMSDDFPGSFFVE